MRHLKKSLWPHVASATTDTNGQDIEVWCREFLGNKSHGWYLYSEGSANTVVVAFKDEEDLLSFKLKWNTKNA